MYSLESQVAHEGCCPALRPCSGGITSGFGGFKIGQAGFLWLFRWPASGDLRATLGLPNGGRRPSAGGLGKLRLVLSRPRDTSPRCVARCEPLQCVCRPGVRPLTRPSEAATRFSNLLGQDERGSRPSRPACPPPLSVEESEARRVKNFLKGQIRGDSLRPNNGTESRSQGPGLPAVHPCPPSFPHYWHVPVSVPWGHCPLTSL